MAPTQQDLGPLHQAILEGDVAYTRFLLEEGADPNEQAVDGETPLHYAMLFKTSAEIAKILIENGADPEGMNKQGFTPLIYAVRYRNIEAVALLIGEKVDPERKENYSGMTPLQWAQTVGYPEMQEMLISALDVKREQAAEKTAQDARETQQKKLATLRDTATERQAALKKRRPTIIVRGS